MKRQHFYDTAYDIDIANIKFKRFSNIFQEDVQLYNSMCNCSKH